MVTGFGNAIQKTDLSPFLFDIPPQYNLYLKIMLNRNLILVKAILGTAWHFKAVAEGGSVS